MHSYALLTSALAVGALALPNPLDKRQQVTVTVTVFVNPYATPAWTAPQFSQTPNTRRPANAPPLWTPPRVGNPAPVRTSSTRLASSSSTSTRPTSSSSASSTRPTGSTVVAPGGTSIVAPGGTSIVAPGGASIVTPPVVGPISTGSVSATVAVPTSPSVGLPGASSAATPTVPSSATTTPAPSVVPNNGHISGSSQAFLSVGLEYQRAILYHHNAARANHGANPLTWDDTLAQTAALAANTCRFEHYIPDGVSQGQNLFTTSGTAFNVTAGITESWYKSEFPFMRNYFGVADIPDAVFHDVGHLTQVLWKGTTKVGCVSLDCGTRMIVGGQPSTLNKYTVCNYSPPGNYGGQYAINVGLPISTTNLGKWSD